jgi:cell division protein FtsB
MDFRVGRLPKVVKVPEFSKPERLRTLVERAPEAEAWAERTMERFRPMLSKAYGIRRKFATIAVVVFTAWMLLHVMLGANGMVIYQQKKNDIQTLKKEVDALQKENDQYSQQIRALQTDPRMIEKVAREQLQYTRPGEVIYVSPEPPQPPPAATNSARK